MKLAVIGAGLMGRAVLADFARHEEVEQLAIFDLDRDLAEEIGRKYSAGKATAGVIDATDEDQAAAILAQFDAAVACTSYRHNISLTRAAIKGGCHLVDLGGNNEVVATQMAMNAEAEAADVMIVPDCGLAPGMVSLIVADGVARLDTTTAAMIRVGGLPQSPRPPLDYQMVFSAEGLINEYWEPCTILENGQKKTVNPMTAVEELVFDGIGQLEAFYTSGGTSTLPDTYLGKIDFLDYKTIRYPGHCHLFKAMLELGLASRKPIMVGRDSVEPRALFQAVLDRSLSFDDRDLVLVRVTVKGTKEGAEKTIVYEIVDRQDTATGLTAMMRCTAFPAAIIAHMIAAGQVTARGVKPQELVAKPSLFLPQLKKRGINLVIKESGAV